MRKALVMLGELSDSDIEWIAKTGIRQILPAGSVIIAEGVEIKSLFIILTGWPLSACAARTGAAGQRRIAGRDFDDRQAAAHGDGDGGD